MSYFSKVIKIINKIFGNKLQYKYSKNVGSLTEDFRLDYRNSQLKGLIIENYNFTNIDFSYSTFIDIIIINTKFENCIFENVKLEEINEKGNNFVNCVFKNVIIKKSYIGYLGSVYSKCEFVNCRIFQLDFIRPFFEKCTFNSQLKNIDFYGSTFENCTFRNYIKDSWFRGGFPSNLDIKDFGKCKGNFLGINDFSQLEFNDLTFSDNCILKGISLPPDAKYRYYDNWNLTLTLFISKAKEKLDSKLFAEAEILYNSYFTHAKNQTEMILNLEDIKLQFPEEIYMIFSEIQPR